MANDIVTVKDGLYGLDLKMDASGLVARGFQGVLGVFGYVLLCYAHSHGRGFHSKSIERGGHRARTLDAVGDKEEWGGYTWI